MLKHWSKGPIFSFLGFTFILLLINVLNIGAFGLTRISLVTLAISLFGCIIMFCFSHYEFNNLKEEKFVKKGYQYLNNTNAMYLPIYDKNELIRFHMIKIKDGLLDESKYVDVKDIELATTVYEDFKKDLK